MSSDKYAVRNSYGYTEQLSLSSIRNLIEMGEGSNFTMLDKKFGGKTIGEVFSVGDGSVMYDRGARSEHEPIGAEGEALLRTGEGHGSQWYGDKYRLSRDTDGVGDNEVHWTNQDVKKGKRRYGKRHETPPDAQ